MKDYYEEHGAPEEDNEGDDTEPEEEEEEEAAGTGAKRAATKPTLEHKVQTRVRRFRPESLPQADLLNVVSLGCANSQRHQRIQISRSRSTCAYPCSAFHKWL
jgi:hypothetical protein